MPTEADLIRAFFEEGDRSAYNQIVDRHAGFVFNIALGILHDRDQAEDATQNVFLSLLKYAGSRKEVDSLRAWLGRVAYTSALNILKRSQRRMKHEQQAGVERVRANGGKESDPATFLAELKRLVMKLPLDLRTPLLLKYFQKTPQAEIARILGCSAGTVSNRLEAARKRLKEVVAQAGIAAMVPNLEPLLSQLRVETVPSSLIQTLQALPGHGGATLLPTAGRWASRMIKLGAGAAVVAAAVFGLAFLVVDWQSSPSEESLLVQAGGEGTEDADKENTAEELTGRVHGSDPDRQGGSSGTGTEGRESPPQQKIAVLSGRVFDRKGNPLSSALVEVFEGYVNYSGFGFNRIDSYFKECQEDKVVGKTRTDPEGAFSFLEGELPSGTYGIRASFPSLATVSVHQIQVVSSVQGAPIQMVLPPPYSLAGRVLTASKAPVAGARVTAFRRVTGVMKESFYDKFETGTNADGRFEFRNLPPGEVNLAVAAPGRPILRIRAIRLPVPREGTIVLPDGYTLRGRVLDKTSDRPIPGANVSTLGRGAFLRVAVEEDKGYILYGLLPGTTHVMVQAPGYLPQTAEVKGVAGASVTRDFRLARGVTVTGRVVDGTGKPISGAWIAADLPYDEVFCGGGAVETFSGPDGAFTISGIPVRIQKEKPPEDEEGEKELVIPSDNEVVREAMRKKFQEAMAERKKGVPFEKATISLSVLKEGWVRREDRMEVEVSRDTQRVDGVEIVLESAPRISGKVVDAQGTPVAGVEVLPVDYLVHGGEYLRRGKVRSVHTDAHGRFAVNVFPGLKGRLWVYHPDHAVQFHAIKALSAGEALKDVLVRFTAGGGIRGILLDEEGKPMPAVRILYDYDGARRIKKEPSDLFADGPSFGVPRWAFEQGKKRWKAGVRRVNAYYPPVYTDAKGRFTLAHLRPGLWDVRAKVDEAPPLLTRTFEVKEGEWTQFRYDLSSLLSLEGIVVDVSGRPLKRALVRAANSEEAKNTHTGRDGTFKIIGLPAGSYEVLAYAGESDTRDCYIPVRIRNIRAGTEGLKIVMKKYGFIAGVVVDETGKPMEGIEVAIEVEDGSGWRTSESDGSFEFNELDRKEYKVTASKEGFEPVVFEKVTAGTADLKIVMKRSEGK
ncbi:MAG: sigma-70 family RNA polymerase sigma factor [Planctomycetota bacterium]|jgi:RNA polymerase sigma-70 factor (ECF subfamily)